MQSGAGKHLHLMAPGVENHCLCVCVCVCVCVCSCKYFVQLSWGTAGMCAVSSSQDTRQNVHEEGTLADVTVCSLFCAQ
jgi:hypothetical protein